MVAAGAVVLPGTVVPSGELWGGVPAAKLRAMKPEERSYLPSLASSYAALAAQHSKAVPRTPQARTPTYLTPLPQPGPGQRRSPTRVLRDLRSHMGGALHGARRLQLLCLLAVASLAAL